MPRPSLGLTVSYSPREWILRTKLSLPVPDWSTSWSRTRCLFNTRLSLPRADLGLYHGPRPDIYHSTEWSLNTGLSLHRGPGPGGPILRREGLSMLLRKSTTGRHKIQSRGRILHSHEGGVNQFTYHRYIVTMV